MDSPFLMKLRNATFNLEKLTEQDIEKLRKYTVELCRSIEDTILRHPDIGKRQLIGNIREINQEIKYVESKVKNALKKLEEAGLTEYDMKYSITKEVGHSLDDCLGRLMELGANYFPETMVQLPSHLKSYLTPLMRQALSTFDQNINEAAPSDNTTSEHLSIPQAALLCSYLVVKNNDYDVPDDETGNKLVRQLTQHKSGAKLRQIFTILQLKNNRTGVGKESTRSHNNRIRDFNAVIERLKKMNHHDLAETAMNELNEYIINFNKG
jgi:DNA-binding Lrp family transcriptional regulator